jgi:L-cysteine S-thiosulfotransferase
MRLGWRGLAIGFVLSGLMGAGVETRRSGFDDMTPALQTMQRDDASNPGQLWVREGQALWQRAAPGNGRRCADCHAPGQLDGVAARYPVAEGAGGAITLAGRIDQCRQRHQQLPAQGSDGDEVLALAAWLAHRSRGTPIAPDPRLAAWQARGEELWRQRFGQLNLACAQCHDERAGQRLGGAPIPQGHATGYPIYRLEWQTLGSLERRLRGCLVGVRAEPFAPGADEWLALEAYLMRRAAGMRHEGVAVRP